MTAELRGNPWDLASDEVGQDAQVEHVQPALLDVPTGYQMPRGAGDAGAEITPVAGRVLHELLMPDAPRDVTSDELPDALRAQIVAHLRPAVDTWPESSLWLSKSSLIAVSKCEGAFQHSRSLPYSGIALPVAVGQVAHRAIQISYTHPHRSVEDSVRAAIDAQCDSDQKFHDYWHESDIAVQSDVITQSVSKTLAFLDSWPALNPDWYPRFEEAMSAKIPPVTLSVRPDLVLGRPRPDRRQTMFLCDFKTGELKDEHEREAGIYALVSTLRHGVAPFRSAVFSLASGTWVAPDITADFLLDMATWVGEQASNTAEVLLEQREATLVVSGQCSWCPLQKTCEAYQDSASATAGTE